MVRIYIYIYTNGPLKILTHRHQLRESSSSTDKSHGLRSPRPPPPPPSFQATRPSSDRPPRRPDRIHRPRDDVVAAAAVTVAGPVVAAAAVVGHPARVDRRSIVVADRANCRDAVGRMQ